MAKEKKSLGAEFKEFVSRGNVLDMAVGIIIGSAFTAIVNSLVNDIITPLISIILGGFGMDRWGFYVKFPWVAWLNEEFDAGIAYPYVAIGLFIEAIIQFLITAVALFAVIKLINKIRKGIDDKKKKPEEAPAAPTTKICPYCKSEISIEATRCPHCTSMLEGNQQ